MKRILKAFTYSFDGFKVVIKEPAFYQEFGLCIFAIVALCFLPFPLLFKALIVASHIFTLIVEVINTAIEAVVDLASPEIHPLAKVAKDLGSLSVLLAFTIMALFWGLALFLQYA